MKDVFIAHPFFSRGGGDGNYSNENACAMFFEPGSVDLGDK